MRRTSFNGVARAKLAGAYIQLKGAIPLQALYACSSWSVLTLA